MLREAIDATARPMEWGRDDCALWVADVARAMHGHDPAQAFRGRYRSAREAIRLWRAAGGLDVLIGKSLEAEGWRRIDPAEAKDGDIGIVRAHPVRADRVAAAIHHCGYWIARGAIGVVAFPDALEAWTCRP